jgi:hypothetical protein
MHGVCAHAAGRADGEGRLAERAVDAHGKTRVAVSAGRNVVKPHRGGACAGLGMCAYTY